MADTDPPNPLDAKLRQGQFWLQNHLLNLAEPILRDVVDARPDHGAASVCTASPSF